MKNDVAGGAQNSATHCKQIPDQANIVFGRMTVRKIFPGLDILRFSLACYVILFHTLFEYPGIESIPMTDIFKFGGYVTSTFFVLSGFILAHVYIGTATGTGLRVSTSQFFVNRFTNLYPIHIITLLLTVALMAAGSRPYDVVLAGVDWTPHLIYTMSKAEVAVNALLQAWNPRYVAFNIPAWSLSTLFFFYLCFPTLAPRLLRMRRKHVMLVVMWIACLIPPAIVIVFSSYGPWTIGALHTNPLIRLPEFLAGILAYGIFAEHDEWIVNFAGRYRLVAIGMLAVIFAGATYVYTNGPISWRVLLHNGAMLPTQIALILICASVLREASPRTVKWTSRLGNASLSVFAIQWPLFILFIKVQKALTIPYPLLSCVHRLPVCAQAVSAVPRQFSYYPLYLVVTLLASVLFQEKVIVPLRAPLRRMLTHQLNAGPTQAHEGHLPKQSALPHR
jgi:peptidoglycan/LPS O-acetylase OafA/YrhL